MHEILVNEAAQRNEPWLPQLPFVPSSQVAGGDGAAGVPSHAIQAPLGPYLHAGDNAQAAVTPWAAGISLPGFISRLRSVDTRLRHAVRAGQRDRVETLLAGSISKQDLNAVSRRGHCALHHAVRNGDAEMVRLLLLHGAQAGVVSLPRA